MQSTSQLVEKLLSGFTSIDREKAENALRHGQSVSGYVDGKPYWANPDQTISEAPKSDICLTLDDE